MEQLDPTPRGNRTTPPYITVVTPVHNEEAGLDVYRQTVERVLFSQEDVRFDVLFVDDGSSDGSWRIIERICQENPRYRALRLSRNFGPHVALSAGIQHCHSDAVCTLAADLQDPVETLLRFVAKWKGGAQIVFGRRRTRNDVAWRKWASSVFTRLVRKYAMPLGSRFTTGSFFLIDRLVIDAFRQFSEHNRIVFALVAWTGFEQDVVDYDRQARQSGTSGWTFGRMIKAMYDAFIGFSRLPAVLMTAMGAILFLLTLLMAVALTVIRLVDSTVLPGWTGIMVALCLFFGITFFMLGIIGEYLARIYVESTGRPLYFVSRTIGIERVRGDDTH